MSAKRAAWRRYGIANNFREIPGSYFPSVERREFSPRDCGGGPSSKIEEGPERFREFPRSASSTFDEALGGPVKRPDPPLFLIIFDGGSAAYVALRPTCEAKGALRSSEPARRRTGGVNPPARSNKTGQARATGPPFFLTQGRSPASRLRPTRSLPSKCRK